MLISKRHLFFLCGPRIHVDWFWNVTQFAMPWLPCKPFDLGFWPPVIPELWSGKNVISQAASEMWEQWFDDILLNQGFGMHRREWTLLVDTVYISKIDNFISFKKYQMLEKFIDMYSDMMITNFRES